ncbi:hypothetical protein K505DRAFT_327252, partial [Melanomma pulvis-pyrius CBS 109.77]
MAVRCGAVRWARWPWALLGRGQARAPPWLCAVLARGGSIAGDETAARQKGQGRHPTWSEILKTPLSPRPSPPCPQHHTNTSA